MESRVFFPGTQAPKIGPKCNCLYMTCEVSWDILISSAIAWSWFFVAHLPHPTILFHSIHTLVSNLTVSCLSSFCISLCFFFVLFYLFLFCILYFSLYHPLCSSHRRKLRSAKRLTFLLLSLSRYLGYHLVALTTFQDPYSALLCPQIRQQFLPLSFYHRRRWGLHHLLRQSIPRLHRHQVISVLVSTHPQRIPTMTIRIRTTDVVILP